MFAAAVDGRDRRQRRARDWVVFALCTIVGGLLGLGYYLVQAPVYTAETTVLVLPTAAGLDSTVSAASDIQIETEAEIANSAQTAVAAAERLTNRISAETLRDDSDVTVTPNSQVLTVTFIADDPALARDGAQALAEAYLAQRSTAAAALVKTSVDTLTEKQKSLQSDFQKYTNVLRDENASSATRSAAQANVSLISAQLADVNSRLVALRVQNTNGGQVISAAGLPAAPTSPVLWIDVVAGLTVGALVGAGLMLLMDRRRAASPAASGAAAPEAALPAAAVTVTPAPAAPRAAAARPAAEATEAPATAPAEPVKPPAAAPTGVTAAALRGTDPESGLQVLAALDLGERGVPSDQDHQALRALCRAIGDRPDHPGPLVLVGVDYHVLMTEAAYAVADAWIAEYGSNALVLADVDTPALPTRPTLDGRGLTDVLSGEWSVGDAVTALDGESAVVLGPGMDPTELPPATQRHRLQSLWQDLAKTYGSATVEIQVPFESALAQNIVQTAGPVVVVVKGGLSQQQDLSYAIEQLTWLGLSHHVVGVVSVSGRARTGAGPSVDLSPAKAPAVPEAEVPAKRQPAKRQDGDRGLARPGAGRAGS